MPSHDPGLPCPPARAGGDALLHRTEAIDRLPPALCRALRTDHAGETGAVMIYRGILAVTRDAQLRDFAAHHLATEQRHLGLIAQVVPPRWRSRLLPLWRLSGWLAGALPACVGPRAVYATIQAVETFVDRHYAVQVTAVDALLDGPAGDGLHPDTRRALQALRALLETCRLDEVAHRDEAAARWDGRTGMLLAAWQALVGRGSALAVGVCHHL
jgi:ubiquinone biosynthesis monooxygenase Coq7